MDGERDESTEEGEVVTGKRRGLFSSPRLILTSLTVHSYRW